MGVRGASKGATYCPLCRTMAVATPVQKTCEFRPGMMIVIANPAPWPGARCGCNGVIRAVSHRLREDSDGGQSA